MVDTVAVSSQFIGYYCKSIPPSVRAARGQTVDPFDAYYQWLGIPPEEQPPDHYRLLGLRPFEDNPTVISHAADRQMAHLRTFQTGPHSAESQRLLNEAAAARVCLLNAEKKAAYDERLRAALAESRPSELPSQAAAAADPQLARLLDHVSQRESNGPARAKANRPATRRRLELVVWLAVLVAGAAVLGWALVRPRDSELAERGQLALAPPPRPGPPRAYHPATEDIPPRTPGVSRVQPPAVAPHPVKTRPRETDKVSKPQPATPETHPPSGAREELPVRPGNGRSPLADQRAAVRTRRPVPSADTQRRIAGALDEIYVFSKNRTPDQIDELINELLAHGAQRDDKADEQFVMLHKAMEIAAASVRTNRVLQAVDLLGQHYEIDPWPLREATFKQMAAEIKGAEPARHFLSSLEEVHRRALDAHRYEVAEELARAGNRASVETADVAIRKKWKESYAAASRLRRKADKIQEVEKRLETSPDDPDDNDIVGRWYCFEREDWRRGLPRLAKGSDAALAELAGDELRQATTGPDEQVRLADAWWELAEKAKKSWRAAIRRHAAQWYRLAEPGLDGVAKLKVEKRLAETEQSPGAEERGRHQRRDYRCQVAAMADDQFEMYLNGQPFMTGTPGGALSARVGMLAHGDILTVRAVNLGGPRGFVLAILSENGGFVVTGPLWRRYSPKSPEQWYLPDQIDRLAPVVAGDPRLAKKFFDRTRAQAASIWGTESTCYLVLRVP